MVGNFFRTISAYVALSGVLAVLALAIAYPWHPVTLVGSAVWFLAAVPIYLLLELAWNQLLSDRVRDKIDTNESHVSIRRILYVFLVLIAVVVVIQLAFMFVIDADYTFVSRHFSNEW